MGFLEPIANQLVRVTWLRAVQILGVIISVFLVCAPSYSQLSTGRILGAITDQTGGAIAGATVTVTNTQQGTSRALTTDQSGEYVAPNLIPGTYSVSAEAKGFKTVEHLGIVLEVAKDVRIDLTLQPGEQIQTITVTGATPMVETSTATLGGTLSNAAINDLPLNGRNFENLLDLRPGVSLYPGGGSRTQSSDGIRAEDQVYVLDGLNNTEPYTGYNMVNTVNLAGDAGTIVSIDAIQEFNVEENPEAESGWKPGAVVNVGIKSGTNSVHGTAFAFGRDDSFDARNYFNVVPQVKTPAALEQFGGTVGGPIKKDKLFYFLTYEDQRYSVGNSYNIVAPITVATGGTAASSIQAACLAAMAAGPVSANSAKIAGLSTSCVPLSNYPGLFPVNNGPTTSYVNNQTSHQQSDNGIAKGDYHINNRNTLSGTYFYGQGLGTFMDAPSEIQPEWLSQGDMRVQVGSGSWTWNPSSSWTNELRAGYDRFFRSFLTADAGIDPQKYMVNGSDYSLNTGVTNPLNFGFPIIRFNSLSSGLFRLGGNWPKIIGPNGVSQVVDHVSYLHGNHAFMFGGEIIYNQDHSYITANAKGQIRFASLESFFTGTTANNSQILVGNATRNVHDFGYAAFVQDDWRIKPRLTLNLGLRWEMVTVPVESNNQFGNFSPTQGLEQVGIQIKSPFNGDHNNFAPRLGLAWDLSGNGKTVVRAGFALMYEELDELQVFLGLGNTLGLGTVPTGAIINSSGGTSGGNIDFAPIIFGTGKLPWNASSVGGTSIFPGGTLNCFLTPCTVMSVDPNLRTPYVTSYSLDVQHAITNNLALTVGYVGNHGTKLLGFTDINQPPVGSGYAAGCAVASVCEQDARPFAATFPYLASIAHLSNLERSNYNSLQATLTARATHGLTFSAGYTYAHALDDASANFGSGIPVDSSHLQQLMYGPSDFDLRHRFTLTTTYEIPGKKSPGQLLEGWQINSVVTLQSGAPWYAQDASNDLSGTGEVGVTGSNLEPWDFFGNPKDFTSNQYAFPYCTGTATGVTNCQAPTASGFLSNGQAAADWNNCMTHAAALPLGPNGQTGTQSLVSFGCYVSTNGNSILIPPALGTLGTSGRDIFRDSGFRDWDVSVVKNWKFRERLTAQFRAEFFNVLNHPSFANPRGGQNGYANNDLSGGYGMGCGCATPDQAGQNPVLGTGGARDIQFGLKLIF